LYAVADGIWLGFFHKHCQFRAERLGADGSFWGCGMIVYLATNTVNGMQYVGLTRRTVLERRVFEHRSSSRRGAGKENTLAHAMRTYGEDVFSFRVIQRVQSLEALSAAEKYWIREYNTNWPNGYNVKKGGCHTDPLTTGKNIVSKEKYITDAGNWVMPLGLIQKRLGRV